MDTAQPPETACVHKVPDQDRFLVQAFLDGDEGSFSLLVTKYRREVFAVAYRFTNNAEEADDLAQETFIKAYQNLHKFRGEASFRTWLLRIVTNASINTTKSSRINKDVGEAPEEGLLDSPSQSPLGGLLHRERKHKLRRAITRLPRKQRETLLLKTYGDLTCEEVAKVMRCSVGTVKANIFNALKRLKSLVKPGAAP